MTYLKNLVITVVIAALVGFGAAAISIHSSSPTLGTGATNTNIDAYANGLQVGNVVTRYVGGQIPAQQNQGSYCNKTGRTAWVDLVLASTDGTASSTYHIIVGTSTAATITDFATPSFNNESLIAFPLATSSTATTTSNEIGSGGAVISKQVQATTIADGQCLNIALEQGNVATAAPSAGCASSGGVCESATSTKRGFNINWVARILYRP